MSCHVICSWLAPLEMETSTTHSWQVHVTIIACNVRERSQNPVYTILLVKHSSLCPFLRKAPSLVTSAGRERSDVAGNNLSASVVSHEKKHVNINCPQHYHIPKSWKAESKNWSALCHSYKYRQRRSPVGPRNLDLLSREVGFHRSPLKAWNLITRDPLPIMGQQAFSIYRMLRRTSRRLVLCQMTRQQALMANA